MAMLSIGENVRRKWDDRRGVVREVEEGLIRQDGYRVKWFDGGEDWESEDQLLPA